MLYKLGSNKYYENYARLSLIKLFGYSLDDFIIDDKPDLQSTKLDIGIEVTSGGIEQDQYAKSISINYFPNNYNEEDFKVRINKHFPDFNGEVGKYDNVAVVITRNNSIDCYINNMIQTIITKANKFKYYKHFKENDLYIFTEHSFLTIHDIKRVIKGVKKKTIISFNKIYFNVIDRLIVYSENSFNEYIISNELLAWLKKMQLNIINNKY